MVKRLRITTIIMLTIVVACLAVWVALAPEVASIPLVLLAIMVLIFASSTFTLFKFYEDLSMRMDEMLASLGISLPAHTSMEKKLQSLQSENSRRSQIYSPGLNSKRLESREDLTNSLEEIANRAYSILDARSVELVLYGGETTKYHSSFVIGRPISNHDRNTQKTIEEDMNISPLRFADAELGTITVVSRSGALTSEAKQRMLDTLALQCVIAIVNCQYTAEILRLQRYSDESIRAKTGFLANLSHELRGPLGTIMNGVEIVLDGLCGEINNRQKELLAMVSREGQHLLELVNDVLDYAKSESGKIVPKPAKILMSEILKDVSNVVRTQVHQKKQKFHTEIPDDIGGVLCDRRHIRQILINLLTNAVKYTPDGGSIELRCERAPSNRIKISVKDTGIGIDSTDHHKVFAPFERIENSYTLEQVGTGLGMPLTKKLVEANNGTIDFKSALGAGSEFWITLAAENSEDLTDGISKEREVIRPGNGQLVILIDPDRQTGTLINTYLSHHGYHTLMAESIKNAAENSKFGEASIIVISNKLIDDTPDGIDTLRTLSKNKQIPIVALTSRAFDFDTEHYLKKGVDRCISKPVELVELSKALNEILT